METHTSCNDQPKTTESECVNPCTTHAVSVNPYNSNQVCTSSPWILNLLPNQAWAAELGASAKVELLVGMA